MIIVGLMILHVFAANAQDEEISTLRLEDFFYMEFVSSPQISPDGTEIIYTRRWINKYEDRTESDLWITKADGNNNRFLMKGGSPMWSPDGKHLSFVMIDPDKKLWDIKMPKKPNGANWT